MLNPTFMILKFMAVPAVLLRTVPPPEISGLISGVCETNPVG